MEKRIWIKSGIVEELDERQLRLMHLVLDRIRFYYRELHGTRSSLRYPLSLSRLMKLCNRSGSSITMALRYLANTIRLGSDDQPPIYYDRVSSTRNASHRPYRIFLRSHSAHNNEIDRSNRKY